MEPHLFSLTEEVLALYGKTVPRFVQCQVWLKEEERTEIGHSSPSLPPGWTIGPLLPSDAALVNSVWKVILSPCASLVPLSLLV